jgi:putative transposase
MPRPPRAYQPGVSLHVYQRGHNRGVIFHEPNDFQQFLGRARFATAQNDVDVHCYSVMRNHYHMMVTPHSEAGLSRAMKQLDGGYVRYYNRKHDRLGTVWCGRYRAKPLLDERYFWTCFTYIERNGVAAGIVTAAEDDPWSSYRVHACGEPSEWLTPHPLFLGLGSTPIERQIAYRAIFQRCATVSDTL